MFTHAKQGLLHIVQFVPLNIDYVLLYLLVYSPTRVFILYNLDNHEAYSEFILFFPKGILYSGEASGGKFLTNNRSVNQLVATPMVESAVSYTCKNLFQQSWKLDIKLYQLELLCDSLNCIYISLELTGDTVN